jgi:NAD+ diphosphatase
VNGPPRWHAGVDRAAHRRTDRQWLDDAWPRSRVFVIDTSGRVWCTAAPVRLVFITPDRAPAGERLFLGVDTDDTPYFAVVAELPARPELPAQPELPEPRPVTLREVGAALPERDAELLGTAAALVNWHGSHRFAPPTGAETVVTSGGWLRVDAAGTQLFPRTDPAVIVLVHDGVMGPRGRCLLGRNASRPVGRDGRRFFSTLAGFVEPGESAEAAVVREVYEEVGVRVSGLHYLGSQPWPFPGSLMLGFTGVADPAQPLRPDRAEIAEARWFTRADLADVLTGVPDPRGFLPGPASSAGPVALPGPASIAYRLIRTWLES